MYNRSHQSLEHDVLGSLLRTPETNRFFAAFGLAASKGAIQGNLSSLNIQKKSSTAVPAVPDAVRSSKTTAVSDVKTEASPQNQPTLAKVQAELQVCELIQ
jgi:hypothetical protein